jgi:hypothetical protein
MSALSEVRVLVGTTEFGNLTFDGQATARFAEPFLRINVKLFAALDIGFVNVNVVLPVILT